MLDRHYIFWIGTIEFATPILATLVCAAYTVRSANRQPLWVTIPAYLIIYVVGVSLGYSCEFDGDWVKGKSYQSTAWAIAYVAPTILSGCGFVLVLWLGARKAPRQSPRGFEVG